MSKAKKEEAETPPVTDSRGTVFNLRVPPNHAAALEAWRTAQRVPPDKGPTFIRALEHFLAVDGFWPWPPTESGDGKAEKKKT